MKSEYKTHNQYQTSRSEYIGKLPNHWTEKKIKFLTPKVRTGTTPLSIGPDYFTDGEVFWFNPGDFTYENIKLNESQKKIQDAFFEDNRIKKYPEGSVLIVGIGATLGKVGLSIRESYSNQQINAILPSEKYNSTYLAYVLFCYTETLKVYSNATTLGIMNQEKTKNFNIPYPDISEQNLIARFLDQKTSQIDKLIEQKENLLKLLIEKRTAIITQAVTKGLDLIVEMKDSGINWLGEIPKEWEVKRLRFVSNVINSNIDKKTVESQDAVILCNYVDVYKNDYITEGLSFMESTASTEDIKKFVLSIGDVIITKDSESADDIGIPAFVKDNIQGLVCGYHLSLIRVLDDFLNGEFLFYFFKSTFSSSYFEIYAQGVTRFGLSLNSIKSVKIPIPPIDQQKKICEYLEKYLKITNKTIKLFDESIKKLKEYREALIKSAVTGQIDVRKEFSHE